MWGNAPVGCSEWPYSGATPWPNGSSRRALTTVPARTCCGRSGQVSPVGGLGYRRGMHGTSEYDAFGPWIDQVDSVDGLPRLFRGSGIDPAECRLVLKVPRDIARRDATPDMNLYDHLLAVGQDLLTVLSRRGEWYETIRVPFDQILAIEESTDLLDGRLTLHPATGAPISIGFNASARGQIREFVAMLRGLYLPERDSGPDPVGQSGPEVVQAWPMLGAEDRRLVDEYHSIVHKEPGMRLVTWAPRLAVTPIAGRLSPMERFRAMLWPATLQASITIADGREVQVLHRRNWFTTSQGTVWSMARTVLARGRITGIHIGQHDRYQGVYQISLCAGATCLRFPAPAVPEIEAFLSWLSGTQVEAMAGR